MTAPHQVTSQRSILILFGLLAILSACSIKDRLSDFEYPETTLNSETPWPSLVPTDELANSAPKARPEDRTALAGLASRAAELRARTAAMRVGSISPSRIAQLRARAARLSRATF